MDQGIIKTFKAYSVRHVYTSSNKAPDEGKHDTLMAFWKLFNISHCIEMIKLAWEQVNSSTLNACWHQLWPEVVNNFKGFSFIENEAKEIVQIAKAKEKSKN